MSRLKDQMTSNERLDAYFKGEEVDRRPRHDPGGHVQPDPPVPQQKRSIQ